MKHQRLHKKCFPAFWFSNVKLTFWIFYVQNEKKVKKQDSKRKKSKNDDFFHFEYEKIEKSKQQLLFIEIIQNNGAETVIRIRRFNSSSQIMHFTNEFMYCICKQKKQTKLKTTNQPLKQSIFRWILAIEHTFHINYL